MLMLTSGWRRFFLSVGSDSSNSRRSITHQMCQPQYNSLYGVWEFIHFTTIEKCFQNVLGLVITSIERWIWLSSQLILETKTFIRLQVTPPIPLSAVEDLLSQFHSPSTNNARKREIECTLIELQNNQNTWSSSLYNLANTSNQYMWFFNVSTVEVSRVTSDLSVLVLMKKKRFSSWLSWRNGVA